VQRHRQKFTGHTRNDFSGVGCFQLTLCIHVQLHWTVPGTHHIIQNALQRAKHLHSLPWVRKKAML
jgi:uncharacterized membrane protein